MCSITPFNDKGSKPTYREHPDYDELYLVRPIINSQNNRFSFMPKEQQIDHCHINNPDNIRV